jgi:hypothetical protein
MTDISLTSANIRAMQQHGAVVRRFDAGAALTVGYGVYLASDGDVEHCDGNAGQAIAKCIGIVVESYDGETAIVAGDPASVCVFGPVEGFSGMTPGDTIYVSDTVGRVADAVGTMTHIVGYAQSSTCVFVDPSKSDPSST